MLCWYADKGSSARGGIVKSRLVVAALALVSLAIGGLVFLVARASGREREVERQRRERLERLGRPVSTPPAPTRRVGQVSR
jgi:hypothetical protein